MKMGSKETKFIKQPQNQLDLDPVTVISQPNNLPNYAAKVNIETLEHGFPMIRKKIEDFLELANKQYGEGGFGIATDVSTPTYGGGSSKEIDFYNTKKKLIDLLEKSKIYFQPDKGEKAPEGAKVQRGGKGGYFYEGKLPGMQWEKGAIKDIEWQKSKGNKTLSGLTIPKTWQPEFTFINRDKKAILQATGLEAKNRRVYLRSAKGIEKGKKEKFKRLKSFNNDLPKILKRLDRDADKKDEAMILLIQHKTGARIGSEEETTGKIKSYGISTLLRKHAKINGEKVTLNYIGKDGVRNIHTIKDSRLAKKISLIKNPEQRIFNVDYKPVLKYLRNISGKNYRSHDFRTWMATSKAIQVIKNLPPPESLKKLRKFQIVVGKEVAKVLGNTYSITLNHYISPDVWTPFYTNFGKDVKKAYNYYNDINDMLETVYYENSDIDEDISKMKVYFQPEKGEKAPEGTQTFEGPKGGKYYISEESEEIATPENISKKFGYKSISIDRIKHLPLNKINETLNTFNYLNKKLQFIFPNINIAKNDLDIIMREWLPDYRKAEALYRYGTKVTKDKVEHIQIIELGSRFKETFFHELAHYFTRNARVNSNTYNTIINEVKNYYNSINLPDVYAEQIKFFRTLPKADEKFIRQIKKILDSRLDHDLKYEEIFANFFNAYVWAKIGEKNPAEPEEHNAFKILLNKLIIPPEKALEIAEKANLDILKSLQDKIKNLEKAKIYLAVGENPPKDQQIQVGPKGGRYYESKLTAFEHAWKRAQERKIKEEVVNNIIEILEQKPLPSTDWWYKIEDNGIIVGTGDTIQTILAPDMKASGVEIE